MFFLVSIKQTINSIFFSITFNCCVKVLTTFRVYCEVWCFHFYISVCNNSLKQHIYLSCLSFINRVAKKTEVLEKLQIWQFMVNKPEEELKYEKLGAKLLIMKNRLKNLKL